MKRPLAACADGDDVSFTYDEVQGARAALDAPADNSALREFALKVG